MTVNHNQSIKISQSTWNTMMDSAKFAEIQRRGTVGELDAATEQQTVYIENNTGVALAQFAPVVLGSLIITANDNIDEFYRPVWPFTGIRATAAKNSPFAIVCEPVEPGALVRAAIEGITPVKLSSSSSHHQFAIPDPDNPQQMKSASAGAPILWRETATGNGWAVILLAGSSDFSYDGPFKVELNNSTLNIAPGYLNRNGEFLPIPAKSGVAPSTGILCLKSTITDGKWTDPDFVIQQPAADAYPIAEITVEDNDGKKNISIKQYPVTVAIILLAKHCPLTRE